MKACIAREPGGPEVLHVEDVDVPEPGEGQVRIKVAYCSLNPLDTHQRAQRVAYKASAFPYTPGFEYSGIVDAVGTGIDASLVGRRKTFLGYPGGCAEYAIAPVNAPFCGFYDIPDGLDWQQGTVFPTAVYTAWHMLHTAARIRPGDTVLLHAGAGSVATVTAQIAHEAGASVIGLCSSQEKIDFARPFGYDHLVNHRDVDWVEAVRELTGGRGADVIIDGIAGPDAPRNFEAVAPLGQVIYLGAIGGYAPPVDISKELYAKTISVRGFLLYVAMQETGGRELPEIHEALRSGRWKVPITGIWELEQVPELHRRFEQRTLLGKQIIRVGGDLEV